MEYLQLCGDKTAVTKVLSKLHVQNFHSYGGKHHKVLPLSKSLIPQKLKTPQNFTFLLAKLECKIIFFLSYLIKSHHLLVKSVTTTKERNEVILNSGNNNAYYFALHSLSQLRNTSAADFLGLAS